MTQKPTEPLNRRDVLLGGAPLMIGAGFYNAAPGAPNVQKVAGVLDLDGAGLEPGSAKDQSKVLQRLMNEAAEKGLMLHIPKGRYMSGPLTVPPQLQMAGSGAETILTFLGGAALLRGAKGGGVRLSNLTLDSGKAAFAGKEDAGLVVFENMVGLVIDHCRIVNSAANGLHLKACSGHVTCNEISQCQRAGLFAVDSAGLSISDNHVHDCANNGVLVWRSKKERDGTLVTNNRIERIGAKEGGSGQNGNGVNVFRAGGVIVSHNVISACAYSAVRNNSGDGVQILNNSCSDLGEVALYAEFAFEGAIISNNIVEGAHAGISVTNFNEGGRLATVTGNLIRAIKKREGRPGIGIGVEADTLVTGNVIEEVDGVGLSLGWQAYMRNATANNNLIRNADIGIGVTTYNEAGFAMIATNMINGVKNGAIRAMDKDKPFGPDLARTSAEAFRNLAIYGNVSI